MYFQLHDASVNKHAVNQPKQEKKRDGERGKESLRNESLEGNGDAGRENHVEKLSCHFSDRRMLLSDSTDPHASRQCSYCSLKESVIKQANI